MARHENEIGGTTDVALHPEFAGRRTTKVVDGVPVTGWFTEDFTLAELRTLRAPGAAVAAARREHGLRRALPGPDPGRGARPGPALADGGRPPVGVYPETKHPTYFAEPGAAAGGPAGRLLEDHGYADADDPVVIQSFETTNLQRLSRLTALPLVQLVEAEGAPYDLVSSGDPRTYADLVTPAGLAEISGYAGAVGLHKDLMIPRDAQDRLGEPTDVIADAHAVGLSVTGWTFRQENQFLPADYRLGSDPAGPGDLRAEIETFLAAGMDAFFTDHPDVGDLARRRHAVVTSGVRAGPAQARALSA